MPLLLIFPHVVEHAVPDNAPKNADQILQNNLSEAVFQNNSRASCSVLMEKMTANSHIPLVTSANVMTGMSIRCAQSLKMRYSSILLGKLKHHVVMNASMVLLQKPKRDIGLTCCYRLFRRDLQIRSWDSYLRCYRIRNSL